MALKVVWSAKAETNFFSIINYLETNWTDKEVSNFVRKTDATIKKIQHFPFAFPVSAKNKNLHRCVLSTQNSLVYKVRLRKNEIEIVSLFDNRKALKK